MCRTLLHKHRLLPRELTTDCLAVETHMSLLSQWRSHQGKGWEPMTMHGLTKMCSFLRRKRVSQQEDVPLCYQKTTEEQGLQLKRYFLSRTTEQNLSPSAHAPPRFPLPHSTSVVIEKTSGPAKTDPQIQSCHYVLSSSPLPLSASLTFISVSGTFIFGNRLSVTWKAHILQ